MTEHFQTPYNVDHVFAYRSKCPHTKEIVCSGLHTHENMRVMRASANISKSDKFLPELIGQEPF